MDFVTGLPVGEGFYVILVVVNQLTKMRHLIPCQETTCAPELAYLYIDHLWKLHGLPDVIVSDRGPEFTATFCIQLCQLLKIQPRLCTALRTQTDGQTERANAVMDQYLRSYVSDQQDDWASFLGIAE